MTRGLAVLLLLVAAGPLAPAGASDLSAWARAYDPATGQRFIPVELWIGGDWDGAHVIRMPKAALVFGARGEKAITGPLAWTRPAGGEALQVYERLNRGKRQLFALTRDGTGLGRVYDSRYDRACVDEVKFPLGYWRQGEMREYTVQCSGGRRPRPLSVTIEAIDFVYEAIPHSLRFHWRVDGGQGRGTDMRYTYSPGRGLVHVEGNE